MVGGFAANEQLPHYPARRAVAPSPAWGTRKTRLLSGRPRPPNGRAHAPSRGCRRCAGPPRVLVNQPPNCMETSVNLDVRKAFFAFTELGHATTCRRAGTASRAQAARTVR